jgi:hypothetical protein
MVAQAENQTELAQEIPGSIPKCKEIILGVSMRVSALQLIVKTISEQTLG